MRFTLFILGVFCSAFVSAEVYKCTDKDGNKTYQPRPCSDENSAAKINLLTGSETNLAELKKKQAMEIALKQEKQRQQELEKQKIVQQKQQLLADAINEGNINQQLIKQNLGLFSAYSFPPYTRHDRPSLVDDFAARLPEIERYRRVAAQMALASGKCDRVEASELNIKSTQDNLVFLVDCSNAERIYLSEKEIAAE